MASGHHIASLRLNQLRTSAPELGGYCLPSSTELHKRRLAYGEELKDQQRQSMTMPPPPLRDEITGRSNGYTSGSQTERSSHVSRCVCVHSRPARGSLFTTQNSLF